MLSKKLIRAIIYGLGGFFILSTIWIVKRKTYDSEVHPIELTFEQTYGFDDFDEYILDIRFKKCSKALSDCTIQDSDSEKSLNIKWVRINKNLFLRNQNQWNLDFNNYYLFIKTINAPELKKDAYLSENFHKKDKFVNQIAIYNPEVDSSKENKDKIPSRIISEFNNKGESLTKMITDNYIYTKNMLFSGAEKRNELRIPSLKEVKGLGWTQVDHGLWYKLGALNAQNTLQKLDVIYGEDAIDPRADWYMIPNNLDIEGQEFSTFLTLQNKHLLNSAKTIKKPNLKINSNGEFKILQVADLHFSTGVGECRDPFPEESATDCEADPRTLKFLRKVLDIEKPDFVVLTGDQIFGETSPDALSSLLKSLALFIEYKIPFATVLGNHDDESTLTREQVMQITSNLPYSLSQVGPKKVSGVGNYYLTVDGPKSSNPAMSLWFLDTHKYSPSPKTNPGYDWLKDNQLDWLEIEHAELKPAISKYSHIHLSMAFFHIPIPEFRNFKGDNVVGSAKEGVTASNYNTGVRTVFSKIGVSVVSVGHDHCNDFCLFDVEEGAKSNNNLWLCYGGAAGEGGYAGYGGTSRRVRVFQIDTNRNSVSSWKRLENDPHNIFDKQLLVDGGVARM
ncbi:phosphoprotein phosphatase [Saccharomycopsis crataegensis]|uniref:Phosphoprotein phosphatase n=1 Tax=Saccharomycopsis crataegensis TaxID=43959 RepID=A0AAV5QUX5_9ASCO|nr:phosphoprotein phosphatase [Saccharomycopsis crataegensis]